MIARFLLVVSSSLVVAASPLGAADWPQFRGPDRTGVSKETGLLNEWPEKGPPLLWTFSKAGVGYSGPAVVGDRVYLSGGRGESEFVFALNAENGTEQWATKIGPLFAGNRWNAGPSATPTVDGDLVFALGGGGDLVCVEAATGKERWRKSMLKDLQGEVDSHGGGDEMVGWGFTWAPLVDGDNLICVPGGKDGLLAALDKKTGAVKWRTKEIPEAATYSSPIVAEFAGVRHYLEMTYYGIAAVAPADGSLLWYYKRGRPYKDNSNCVVIPTPVCQDSFVLIDSGFGEGCDLIKVTKSGDKFQATKVYANRNLENENGGFVVVDGRVYGSSEKRKGWTCLDLKTGKVLWADRRSLGNGSIVAADGRLYCYGEEEGIAVLLEPSPKEWTEKGRFEIPQKSKLHKPYGKIWAHPVIANGKFYLRDQELLFCFNIKK